jgi:hypothetical protein
LAEDVSEVIRRLIEDYEKLGKEIEREIEEALSS